MRLLLLLPTCLEKTNVYIYLPAATKLGQGNVFTSMCLSTGGRGVCLSACWDTPLGADPPPDQTPPQKQTPPDQTHPLDQAPPGPGTPPGSRLQHTVNERPVRILLQVRIQDLVKGGGPSFCGRKLPT